MSIERVSVFKTEDGKYWDTEDEAKAWSIGLNVVKDYYEDPFYCYDTGTVSLCELLEWVVKNMELLKLILSLQQEQISKIIDLGE